MADLSWGDLTPAQQAVLDLACNEQERPWGRGWVETARQLVDLGLLGSESDGWRDSPTSLGRKVWEEQG